ncbi:MAG TPA: hypothetical protein VGF41_04540 [Myxococcaceae bacterium]
MDKAEQALQLVPLDTAYADLYRYRARRLAADGFSAADFQALKLAEDAVHLVPGRLQEALDAARWHEVRSLAADLEAKKRLLEDRGSLRKLGEQLYEEGHIHVDPFSPGFHWFHRREERELGPLRDAAIARLAEAARVDPEWSALYKERQRALSAVRLGESTSIERSGAPEQQARDALASGDLAALQTLAARLQMSGTDSGSSTSVETPAPEVGDLPDVEPEPLAAAFAPETLLKARGLGLELEHVENVRERFRSLRRYLWRPLFSETEAGADARVTAMLPKDTPPAFRDRIVMLVTRPVLTSAGARFIPPLVAEDVLVETFEEGPAGAEVGKNGLAEALGLERRWGLSRTTLERLLQSRGPEIVKSLGLDPWKFRLVSVPPDLFGAVGERRGWGRHETWTHLDGYVATRERKLLALAGGDVRYGGDHDLIGIGMGYDSDRLLARFAVVDRRRLRAW